MSFIWVKNFMHALSKATSGHASPRSLESAEKRNKFLQLLVIFQWRGVSKTGGNLSLPGCTPLSIL